MNEGQEKFFSFILDRVQEGRQEEARALMAESFEKQANKTFDADYMASFIPRMTALLKPEHVDEVTGIMAQFKGNN